MAYAERTNVDVGKTRDEIEAMLEKRGSVSFLSGTRSGKLFVAFELNNLKIRFEIQPPAASDFTQTPTGKKRTGEAARKEYEQAVKQRWRALFLSIKAKLVSIEEEIETFEQAFLSHIITDDGATIGQKLIPLLTEVVQNSEIKLLTE